MQLTVHFLTNALQRSSLGGKDGARFEVRTGHVSRGNERARLCENALRYGMLDYARFTGGEGKLQEARAEERA